MTHASAEVSAPAASREERGARACIRGGSFATAVLAAVLVHVWSYSRVWQVLVSLGAAAVCAVCLGVARSALGRGRLERSWTWWMTGALVAYAGLELPLTGVGISVTLGALFVLLRVIGVDQRAVSLRGTLLVALTFAAFMTVVSLLTLIPRHDVARLPPLALTVNGLTAFVGVGVLWHYLHSFRAARTIHVRMLVAFLVIVLVPAGAITVFSATLTYANDRDRVIAHLESVVALKEAEISVWAQDRAVDLDLLTRTERDPMRALLTSADADGARAHLRGRFRLYIDSARHFDELFLLDKRGHILASSNPRNEGEFRGLQEYFRDGLKRPGMYVQTLSFSSASESVNTVIAAQPVVDDGGAVLGVMAGRASLAELNAMMLERAGLGETGETYLVGGNGVLLTDSLFPGYGVGKTYMTTEGVQTALNEHRAIQSLYLDYRREPVLGVVRWLPTLRVVLVGEVDQAEAFRPARLMMTVSTQVAAAAMLLAAFASFMITRSIAAPLSDLAQTAARIAAGERDIEATIARRDEIGALADAFNHMTSDLRRSIEALQTRERALRVSQQQLQAMMDNSTALISMRDAAGRVLLVNHRFEEVVKRPRDAILNKTDLDLFPPGAAERFNAADRRVLGDGRPIEEEEALELDDGQHTYVTLRYPLQDADGEIYAVCAISTDITERKRSEDALRRERDLLARVMATSPAGITVVDRTGRITFANVRAETVLGLSRAEIETRAYDDPAWRITDFEGRPLPPEALPFQRVMTTKQLVAGVRHAIEWPDLRRIFLSVNATPLLDAAGEFDGMVASVEDVTALVESERALRKAHDELESRVTERTRELREAQKELVGAARRAGMAEIATNVLHNVGNVLNSVNTSAALLAERIQGSRAQLLVKVSQMLDDHKHDLPAFLSSDPKGRQLVTLIEHLSKNLMEERAQHQQDIESLMKNIGHIKTIVHLQQYHAGVAGVAERVSLAELMDDAVRISTANLSPGVIRIVREYEALPPLLIDQHKVLQILINLIGNAKNAVLEAPSGDKEITLRIQRAADGGVRIEVQDNGVGIAPENLTRIFQHGFTTRKDGHGFGLHSGALAAREIGGSLTVRSDGVGKGAAFILALRAAPA